MSLSKQAKIKGDLSHEELGYWLAFAQLSGPGIGVKKAQQLWEFFGDIKSAWHASINELKQSGLVLPQTIEKFILTRKEIEPAKLVEMVHAAGVNVLHFYHELYPAYLREIHDPPVVLFMKGNLSAEDIGRCVGVVGTRRPTAYGQRVAKDIAKDLASAGVTVVSGMAVGIDSLAHYGAIEGKGKTIAVLGCGADVCYPSSNRPLYEKLVGQNEYGAVLTEFFPGTKPDAWRFPARNRIISGLSQALAVIEAGDDSGSLITARLAFEQSREVFAVPGRIDNPMSEGTNDLIFKQTAHLLRSAQDILVAMNWATSYGLGKPMPQVVELYGREREVFDLISNEPVHFDYLTERMLIHAGELSAILTMLELSGLITRLPGEWYMRQSRALADGPKN